VHDVPAWPIYLTAGVLSAVTAAYAAAGADPPVAEELVLRFAPWVVGAAWLRRDARAHRVWLPFDWGLLAMSFWPLLLPWYARRTRPGDAAAFALPLMGALLAPPLVGAIASALFRRPPH
jgi:hypothetical protein